MNEFLPIRFDFSLTRAKWKPLIVIPESWHYNGRAFSLVATIPGRINPVGNPSLAFIELDHLPPLAKPEFEAQRLARLRRSYGIPLNEGERGEITVFECQPAWSRSRPRKRDPRKLRDDFLGLREDIADLLEFLNYYGAWWHYFSFGRWWADSDFSAKSPKQPTPYIVSPYYFWRYRTLLRSRLEKATHEPATWFASTIDPPRLQRIPDYPFHCYRVSYGLEAIEASFTFDLLKQVPMSLCAREDCRKPYFVTRKSKTFCCEKCARCVVTRRGRAKKKTESTKG